MLRPILIALAIVLIQSAHARSKNGYMRPLCEKFAASSRSAYSPTQKKVVNYKPWIDVDVIRWNERYIPEFKDIVERSKREAVRNQSFKSSFVNTPTIQYTDEQIDKQNMVRLRSECGNSEEKLFACPHFQADCAMQMSNNVLTDALNSFAECAITQKDYCGKSFTTPEGVKKNMDSLHAAHEEIMKIKASIERDPYLSEYFGDVDKAFRPLHDAYERAQEAMKNTKDFFKSQAAMEKAIKDFGDDANKQYKNYQKMNGDFRKAVDVLNKCDDYLEKKGLSDNHSVLPQINICQIDVGKPDPAELKEFTAIMDNLEESNKQNDLKLVATKSLENGIELTVKEFASIFKAMTGRAPTTKDLCMGKQKQPPHGLTSPFCKDPRALGALKQTVEKDLPNVPQMNMRGEIESFNKYVAQLNSACKAAAAAKKNGTNLKQHEQKIQQKLTDVMYKTRVGQLMGFEKFRKEFPPLDTQKCIDSGVGIKQIPNSDAGVDKLTKATWGVMDLQREKSKQLMDWKNQVAYHGKYLNPGDADYEKLLRNLLENDPFTVRQAIKASGNPDQALWLCHATADIYRREKRENTWKWIGTGVCIAGSLAATVFTFGAATPLLIGSIAMGTGIGVYNLNQAITKQHNLSMSAAINSSDDFITAYALQAADEAEKSAYVEIGLSLLPAGFSAAKAGTTLIAKTPLISQSLAAANASKLGVHGKALLESVKNGTQVGKDVIMKALGERLAGSKGLSIVKDFLKGASEDAIIEVSTALALHPEPFNESSVRAMLQGVATGSVMHAGAKGMRWGKDKVVQNFNEARMQVHTTVKEPPKEITIETQRPVEVPKEKVVTNNVQATPTPAPTVKREVAKTPDVKPNKGSANAPEVNKVRLTSDDYQTKPLPLSQADYDREYKAFRTYDENHPLLGHMHGEFKYLESDGVTSQAKLDAGLHTIQGLDFFKKVRPDIAEHISVTELPNGVMVAEIPETGFFKYKFDRLKKSAITTKDIDGQPVRFTKKTLYPKTWSDEDVLKAIEAIRTDKASFSYPRKDVVIKQGIYEGIPMELVIQGDVVKTAYPLSEVPPELSKHLLELVGQ